jgi:hypothetical protein
LSSTVCTGGGAGTVDGAVVLGVLVGAVVVGAVEGGAVVAGAAVVAGVVVDGSSIRSSVSERDNHTTAPANTTTTAAANNAAPRRGRPACSDRGGASLTAIGPTTSDSAIGRCPARWNWPYAAS